MKSALSFPFLRGRREKKRDKKTKKDVSNGKEDKSDTDERDGSQQSETPTAEIDDEGYTVRPKTTFENDKSSFYSSSESDSDDERDKRLRIEIKPLSNRAGPLSASVDELRTTVKNMTLSPVGILGRTLVLDAEATMKRSQSVSQRIGSSPPPRHHYHSLNPPAITNHRISDSIPLAVAFHEIVHARFKGNDENMCQVKITGDMMLSFPAGILYIFANNLNPSQLSFQVRTLQRLDNLVWNKELVTMQKGQDDITVDFNMSVLVQLLKKNSEQNPNASYFNVNILKYHVTPKPGAGSCPLHLVAFWKSDSSQIDLRIDYKYNSHAMAPKSSQIPVTNLTLNTKNELPPLLQVCVAAHVDGVVKSMQSKPTGQWFPSTTRACWKLPSISSKTENQGVGTLRARLEVTSCQSSVGAIAAQFSCENSTLSGNEFFLIGSGYRVSLIKKCFVSGKYTCDAEETFSCKNSRTTPVQLS